MGSHPLNQAVVHSQPTRTYFWNDAHGCHLDMSRRHEV
jgi:hypothetical protein